MRILILSDVHANQEALHACMAAAPEYDIAVNLGDVVGYGGSPNEVLEEIRGICRLHVRGNHDKVCSGIMGVQGFNPAAALAASWTSEMLTPENTAWLRALPSGPLTLDGAEDARFVHGSPLHEDEYIMDISDALQVLLHQTIHVTFFGHSHMQGGFVLYRNSGSEFQVHIDIGDAVDFSELHLIRTAHYLINPGSVGQPRDGDCRAGFALYDTERDTVWFYRIPYDIEQAKKRILDARLPERLASRLSLGR